MWQGSLTWIMVLSNGCRINIHKKKLYPPPRMNLIRFTGIFAPHSKYRALIVPPPLVEVPKSKYRPPWLFLLKRIFGIDLETCQKCKNGKLRIIATIEDPLVIKKILTHLKLPTGVPKPWQARGPPQQNTPLYDEFYRPSDDEF